MDMFVAQSSAFMAVVAVVRESDLFRLHINFRDELLLNGFLRAKEHIFQVLNLCGFNLQYVLIDPIRNPVPVVLFHFFSSSNDCFPTPESVET